MQFPATFTCFHFKKHIFKLFSHLFLADSLPLRSYTLCRRFHWEAPRAQASFSLFIQINNLQPINFSQFLSTGTSSEFLFLVKPFLRFLPFFFAFLARFLSFLFLAFPCCRGRLNTTLLLLALSKKFLKIT